MSLQYIFNSQTTAVGMIGFPLFFKDLNKMFVWELFVYNSLNPRRNWNKIIEECVNVGIC